MAANPLAPDFEQALGDLQDHLPDWWRKDDPTSNLYQVLAAIAGVYDELAVLFEQSYLDQVLTTASPDGVRRNFAFAWGVQNEQLPTVLPQMVAYLQARAQEDGSLLSLVNTLTALVDTEANTTGGQPLTFPAGVNLVPNPSFEHDTLGSAPASWAAFLTAGTSTFAVENAWAASGSRSCQLTFTSTAVGQFPGWATPSGTAGMPVNPNTAYCATISVNVLACTLSRTTNTFRIRWFDANGAQIRDTGLPAAAILPGIRTFSLFNVTSPSNAAYAQLIVAGQSGAAGETLNGYIDAAMLVPGSTVSGYGDGDQPGWGWTGTPGNSASEQALVFPDPSGTSLVFPIAGGIQLPATFGKQDAGLVMYEFAPGGAPSSALGLVFPANGSGLTFPGYPQSVPSDNVIVKDGTAPVGAGPGLIFGSNQFIEIIPNFATYTLTVQVQSWCAFDRGAFARAVQRFQPMDWLPTVIQEVTNYH